ncbi:MAG: methylenetetrahydrofolate reductase, partial [Lachnospiraceae bacterium]|nr:methylenetetrahydrofolate reductase [Lachnospiraceae bacterium]
LEADIAVLKQKQDNGADYIMTQLCLDMDQFAYWLDAIRQAGITMPVDVGIMPILDQAATINMALSRNGCVMPRELCEIISKNWIFPNPFVKDPFDADVEGKKAAFKEAGIEYTINQIDQYRALGVEGIHLYALNKYQDVSEIIERSGMRTMV